MGSLDSALPVAVRASPHSAAILVHHMIRCPNTGIVNGLSLFVAGKTLRLCSRKELSCLIGLAV